MAKREYIGDGVYADIGLDIRLQTERFEGTHYIHMGHSELAILIQLAVATGFLDAEAIAEIAISSKPVTEPGPASEG